MTMETDGSSYKGYRRVDFASEEFQNIPNIMVSDFLENEYLIAHLEGTDYEEYYRWETMSFRKIPFKMIQNTFVGRVKARNPQQTLAIDMLYDNKTTVKVLTGRFGSGKTFLMCAAATDMVEHGLFEKIVFVRNNIEVKNSKPIGYLPGSNEEKLLPFAMPIADFLGGADVLERMISAGKIEIVHLGFLRGRDLRNSIILCSEAENLTREHIQLMLGRVGEGSQLWIDGDNRQIDAEVFRQENGLEILKERLKGNRLFSCVNLEKTERSETAALADLLN